MTGAGPTSRKADGNSFREAIASWRLALRTEVKRASSLPTAMFDACDPMLETRLAETAEVMLARLQEPDPSLADGDANGEQRIEDVATDELNSLPRRIAAIEPGPLDLEDGLAPEYLGVLTDACCTAVGTAQQRAVQRLGEDFGLTAGGDFDQLTTLLMNQIGRAVAADAAIGDDDLAAICRRVAAAVTLHSIAEPAVAERGQ